MSLGYFWEEKNSCQFFKTSRRIKKHLTIAKKKKIKRIVIKALKP
jgi:hypothetical protein